MSTNVTATDDSGCNTCKQSFTVVLCDAVLSCAMSGLAGVVTVV